MKRTVNKSIVNNIIYVEPNYSYSTEGYGVNGLNTYEFTPPLEDYSIYLNLEVEIRGRNVQSSKSSNGKKLILSFVSHTDGSSSINFMQGSKIPIGENGATLNSLTTSYTDIFLKDIEKNGPSTETFGIKSVDIAYNNYMVPEVTIEFVDVRGVALFAQKEYYETNKNIDNAVSSGNKVDVANTFFQCFFTFPYPKFTLMVKGFYGQPVSYELTCADFRARFDSSTGNFSCTAKFVGYHFSFLNDVMINGLVAAPYSDYIGEEYWNSRNFKLIGTNGEMVTMPRIGKLLNDIKGILKDAKRLAQDNPVSQKKIQLDSEKEDYSIIENLYRNFVDTIRSSITEDKYEGNPVVITQQQDGFITDLLYATKNENNSVFGDFVNKTELLKGRYEELENAISAHNKTYSNDTLPYPDKFFNELPVERIRPLPNSQSMADVAINTGMKELKNELYNKFKYYVTKANDEKVKNPYLDIKKVYYYNDNNFISVLLKHRKKNAESTTKVNKEIEKIEETALATALGFPPSVENLTRIVMAHFETFARMIFKTSKSICNETPPRTIKSLKVNDPYVFSDVKNRSKDMDCIVPPFPKVTSLSEKNGVINRNESWVGDYAGDFREIDLVHGLINGVEEVQKDVSKYLSNESDGVTGSDGAVVTQMRFPLCPIDFVSEKKPYASGGFNPNDISSLLGLVALRAIQILGISNFTDLGDIAEELGKAEAYNLLTDITLNKDMINKLSSCADNVGDVIQMLYGNQSASIKKPDNGTKPWPWRTTTTGGGIISTSGYLNICKVKNDAFSVPYQELGWDKIMKDIVYSKYGNKAIASEDYLNSKGYANITKKNVFTFDTNFKRFSTIVESQLSAENGPNLSKLKDKILDECSYSEYGDKYLTSEASEVIAFTIENASAMIPSDDSCMLPSSKDVFSNKSFGKGYDMDKFHNEYPGEGSGEWKDKDGNDVKRIGENGYNEYLTNLDFGNVTFTEFPGVRANLSTNKRCSVFSQDLYYKQTDDRAKAVLFLASLGNVINYKNVINDFICKEDLTMAVIPLPAVLFIGGLLWLNTREGKTTSIGFTTKYYEDEVNNLFNLRDDVERKFIKVFENWVKNGIEGNRYIHSFVDIKKGMELSLIHKDTPLRKQGDYNFFFSNLGKFSDSSNEWIKKYDASYNSIMDFLKGELSDSFFENYLAIGDNASYMSDDIEIRKGIRLGIRDGGPCSLFASNFALSSCVFSKNLKYFNRSAVTIVKINTGEIENFFAGFLGVVKEMKKEDKTDSSQISQAVSPNKTNTDIKIGIYRYCKLIYDKWIAGLSEEEFEENWTMKAFFDSDKKFFHFIDAYYNKASHITLNVKTFCDAITSCFTSDQYSLLSFLSSIYSDNKFNFICVQNFMDLGKKENMESMFDSVPYTSVWDVKKHPNFIVMYPYESSNYLDNIEDSEYSNDGFMINEQQSDRNIWPEPLKSHNANTSVPYTIPAFGVSYGKMYQSYFKDIDVSMDNPTVTEQSIKAQFAIASMHNEGQQEGDKGDTYIYGQDLYSIYSNNSYTCNVTMMGCSWVQPLMYFVLNNVPMFRGTYLIERVNHHIEPGNMITKFMGVRMSNVCTRIAEENAIRNANDQTGESLGENGDSPNVAEKLADIDNNCPYKEYPLTDNTGCVGGSDDYFKIVKKWEGGYAGNIDGKICTMMGVTLAAFRQYYGNDKTCEDLKNITNEQWSHIMSEVAWKPTRCDEIKNKSIAYLITDWAWGSGCVPYNKVRNILGINARKQCSFSTSDVEAINNYSNQKDLFDKIWNSRKQHFISIANCPSGKKCKFLNGWMNRLNDFHYYDSAPKINKNENGKVSDLANGFLHALNRTSNASAVNVEIGIDINRSSGDTIWLTNAKNNPKFANVFDIILSAYSTKVSDVCWVISDNADQTSVPIAYFVNVREGSKRVNIKVVKESDTINPLDISVSKKASTNNGSANTSASKAEKDVSGIHSSFCKALVKKYKVDSREVRSDTFNKIHDYETLFSNYELDDCNKLLGDMGASNGAVGDLTGNMSNKVTNPLMKKVLSNVNKICLRHNYNNNGSWYDVRKEGATKPCPKGMCTYGPSTWYSTAGNRYDLRFYPGPASATHNNTTLSSYGMKLVWHGTVEESLRLNKSQFRPGDVSTQYYYKTDGKASAHGCMWTGEDWRSDFVQNTIMASRNYTGRDGNYSVCIWRHPDFQEPGATVEEVT